jgi:hypothetical protein
MKKTLMLLFFVCILLSAVCANAAESWRNLYVDYIKDNPALDPEWARYSLVYINDGDIPELLIDYGTGVEGAVLITVSGGKMEAVNFSHGDMLYIERKNLCLIRGGHMDSYYDKVYAIQDGGFVLLHKGEYGAEDNSRVQFDDEDNPIYQYFWNGKAVSKTGYERSLNSVFDVSNAVNPFDNKENTCSANEIISRILDL